MTDTEATAQEAAGDMLAAPSAAMFATHARRYSELGWALIRAEGKRARGSGWQQTQPAEPEFAAGQWQQWGGSWNMGIVLGTSGLVVLEYDDPEAEPLFYKLLGGELPDTPVCRTGSGKLHAFFAAGDEISRRSRDGLELRAGGHHCLVPPSVHPDTGVAYAWLPDREPWTMAPLPVPAELVDFFQANPATRNGRTPPVGDKIPHGRQHHELVSIAGTMRRRGLNADEIYAALSVVNRNRCERPGPDENIRQIADSVAAYDPDPDAAIETIVPVEARTLADVVDTFQRHLHLPDPTPLLLTLGTVVANLMDEGDPVWLAVVGGSSRGKTEIVAAVDGFPGVRVIGALTVAALLSGTSRKDRSKDATGGILVELGERGLLVVKDLGAILTLHRDARAQVLQALRDIYDGLYTRDVGADGGTKLRWTGRIGLIAGATSALDSAHAVLSALGERWVTVRLPESGEGEMAKISLRHTDTAVMRSELRDAVHGFLAPLENVRLRPVTAEEEELLVALSCLVCLARSPVERDPYKRDIVYVHAPEGPGRIVRQLHKLLVALEEMGADDPAGIIVRAGLDSIPSPRRDVLLHLLRHGEKSTTDIATVLGIPSQSTRRACEELNAHALIVRRKSSEADNSPNLWTPARRTVGFWGNISPKESA